MSSSASQIVLIVEDCNSLSEMYSGYLEDEGYRCIVAQDGKDAENVVADEGRNIDIALIDLKLPDIEGTELMGKIQAMCPDLPVLIITGHGSVNTAVQAMRMGAREFLVKPFPLDKLIYSINRVLEQDITFADSSVEPDSELRSDDQIFHGFIGGSSIMNDVYQIIECAGASDATVFITGESGTGKEVCAEAIHACSARKQKKFIALNCAAIPENLIESEIFGHVKGAFTGAVTDRIGAAALADGGTLFLDEIGELPLVLQAKLLRFIQTLSFQPIGSDKIERVNLRIICATNRDPIAEVAAGRFREDLFYRLHVIPIHMPPLRDRDQDILEMAKAFLRDFSSRENKKFEGYSLDAERELMNYCWPGNVRQMQNIIRNIVVLNDGTTVSSDMLPLELMRKSMNDRTLPHTWDNLVLESDKDDIRPLWIVEKDYIESSIRKCSGNIPKAASQLEVSPSTIYRKIASWKQADKKKHKAGSAA